MPASPNPLRRYFDQNQDGRLIHKWLHYFDIYDRHFAPFRGRPITVVEFGVFHGGSLQMWRDYFGPQARLIGIDINPKCLELADPPTEVILGDQADPTFLTELRERVGPIDVLIEDGGHTMVQQLTTFEHMWPAVTDGGVYLAEDLHTSYWENYGGGLRREGTFIEYTKALMDQVNAWHSRDAEHLKVDEYTQSITGMHIYDSIVVFDKGHVERPRHTVTGVPSFADAIAPRLLAAKAEHDRPAGDA
jgi:23S rRNA U2552 (ribose-2'-O)-methylase RlmE/FtsJ